MPRIARLTREDWAVAALNALAEGGPGAVAVEPVAASLGASKSSFYWLFDNRQALPAAALEQGEKDQTDQVLPQLAAVADPAERLRTLVGQAFAPTGLSALALRLLTETDDLIVREAAQRVTRRRLAAIEAILTELRRTPDPARHLAAASYAIYLGTAALHRVDAAPRDTAARVDTILAAFAIAAQG